MHESSNYVFEIECELRNHYQSHPHLWNAVTALNAFVGLAWTFRNRGCCNKCNNDTHSDFLLQHHRRRCCKQDPKKETWQKRARLGRPKFCQRARARARARADPRPAPARSHCAWAWPEYTLLQSCPRDCCKKVGACENSARQRATFLQSLRSMCLHMECLPSSRWLMDHHSMCKRMFRNDCQTK